MSTYNPATTLFCCEYCGAPSHLCVCADGPKAPEPAQLPRPTVVVSFTRKAEEPKPQGPNNAIDYGSLVDTICDLLREVRPVLKVTEAVGVLAMAQALFIRENQE